jgi:subtilisin family serine protease/flagellar hook assembly protein FlgD
MRVSRRRLLVSAAAILGLLAPVSPTATAASDGGPHDSEKLALLRQLTIPSHTESSLPEPVSGAPLSRLATEHGSGQVVISVKARRGANDTVAVAAVTGAARAQGGKRRQTLLTLDTVTVEVPQAAATAFAAQMRARADVARVQLVPRRWPGLTPNDPRYPAQASYLGAVTAPTAWGVRTSAPGVRIAVVDTGVDVNHPDLIGRIAGTYNAVTGSTNVTDAMGHGTFVAGVAAATGNNGIGIAGASMGASILAVKVADADNLIYADAVARGVIWAADHGAKVINISLGSTMPGQVEREAIAYAIGRGVVVVASAGNAANTTKNYPAAYPQVVAVGATNTATGGRASFSSFGPWVTVAAPGASITGTTPTGGSSFFAAGYDVANGTSFSSPIVAAEAALLESLRPAVSASDIRQAIVKSSHGYANLGLGAGQVDFRAAYSALRPGSVPMLTQPANGATVAGVVQLSATSTAPRVRFLVNGVALGAPVATTAGTARTTWTSWGVANGLRTVTAVDCSIRDLCNTQSGAVGVTLANSVPAITSPTASQTLTGTATFTATAPGGGVAFVIDGVRRGFDATAPYALPYTISSLADGTHTVKAVGCSLTGTACAGPASPLVSFTARSLHPRITAVSPSRFSPNGDRRHDKTQLTYSIPDTEYVRFQIRNTAGTVIRGPVRLGSLGAGTRTVRWNGLLNGGARAGNGTYLLEIATSRGTLRGSAVARVILDTTAPTMRSVTRGGSTFYPYPDHYRDTFTTRLTLSERATVTLTVRTGRGALVRRVAGSRAAGATSIAWNGKNASGARMAAGTYYWTLTAQDPAGNRRTTSRFSVLINSRHVVTRTATLSRRGSQYHTAGGSAGCAGAHRAQSDFSPYGVWLLNDCDSSSEGSQIAGASYRFTLPAARSYTSLRVDTYGNSLLAPSTLGAGFTRWATGGHAATREITVIHANAWRTIGTVSPSGLVSGNRLVETTLYVPNDYDSASDYDISQVRLVVTYKVFART